MTPTRSNNLSLVALGLVAILLLLTGWWAVTGVDMFIKAYRARNELTAIVPVMVRQLTPYSRTDYQTMLAPLRPADNIRIENKGTHLVITATSMQDEALWRATVAEVLALDRNLLASRICGGNACSGQRLLAEVIGRRQHIAVQ